MEIKLKYYWKNGDGKIYVAIVPVGCLEGKGDKPFLGNEKWTLVSRCLYIGLSDKDGCEIFVGDKVLYEACEWEVRFGFHKTNYIKEANYWEYAYGFYLYSEFLKAEEPIDQNTAGQCEVIGNIYEIEKPTA